MTSNLELLKPFSYGWKREIILSYQANNRFRTCIYWRTPEGKRLRSRSDIQDYLDQKNQSFLTKDNFSFVVNPIYREPFEVRKWCSTKKTKNSVASATSSSPVSASVSPSFSPAQTSLGASHYPSDALVGPRTSLTPTSAGSSQFSPNTSVGLNHTLPDQNLSQTYTPNQSNYSAAPSLVRLSHLSDNTSIGSNHSLAGASSFGANCSLAQNSVLSTDSRIPSQSFGGPDLNKLLRATLFSSVSSTAANQNQTSSASAPSNVAESGSETRGIVGNSSSHQGDAMDSAVVPEGAKPVSPDSTVIKTEPETTEVRDPIMETLSMGDLCKTEPAEDGDAVSIKCNIKEEPDCYTIDQIAMMKAYGIEMQENMFKIKEEQEAMSEGGVLQVSQATSLQLTNPTITATAILSNTEDHQGEPLPAQPIAPQIPPGNQNCGNRTASKASSGVYIDVAEDPLMSRQAKNFYGLTDDQATEQGDSSDDTGSPGTASPSLTSHKPTAGKGKASNSASAKTMVQQKKPVGATKIRTPAQERIWKKMMQNKKGGKKMAPSPPPPPPQHQQNDEVYICHLCPQSFTGANAEPNMKSHLWTKHHIYSCDCGETFKRKDYLEKHKRTCTGEVTFFKCSECSEASFKSVDEVKQHVEKKHARSGAKKPSTYKCPRCPAKPYDHISAYKNHMGAVHNKKESEICNVCGALFSKEFSTNVHMLNLHLKGDPFICDKCHTVYFRYATFMSHTCDGGSGKSGGDTPSKTVIQEKPAAAATAASDKDEATFQCFGCNGRTFNNAYNLISHVEGRHLDSVPHIKCACGKTVNSVQAMLKHREKCDQKASKPFGGKRKEDVDISEKTIEEAPTESETEHKCPMCSRTFASLGSVKKHVALGHKEDKVKVTATSKETLTDSEAEHECPLCSKTFASLTSVKKHLAHGHKEDRVKVTPESGSKLCEICGKNFTSEVARNKHMSVYHKQKNFRCSCGQHFNSYAAMHKHKLRCKGGTTKKWGNKCHICAKLYSNSANLKRHLCDLHGLNVKGLALITCMCGEKFVSQTDLIAHRMSCQSRKDRKPKCHVCSTRFSNINSLRRHQLSQHNLGPNLSCPCGETFTKEPAYYLHKKTCSGETSKPSQNRRCRLCGKVYADKWSLRRHSVNVHEDVTCECGKQFDTPGELADHKKICGGHKCSICAKVFLVHTVLLRHLLHVHPDLACLCGQQFNSQAEFKAHSRVCIKKPSKCPICARVFKYRWTQRRHMLRSHQVGKKLVCPMCGEKFTHYKVLRRHKLSCGGENKQPDEVQPGGDPINRICACGKKYRLQFRYNMHIRLCSQMRHVVKAAKPADKQGTKPQKHEGSQADPENMVCACGKMFSVRFRYNLHMKLCAQRSVVERTVHEPDSEKQRPSGNSSSSSSPSQKVCQYCKMKFMQDSSLEEHLWAVHKVGKPLQCMNCNKEFRFKRSLNEHKQICSKKNRKSKELANLLTDAANSFKSPEEKLAVGHRRKAAVLGKAKVKKCINKEARTSVDEYGDDEIEPMDYLDCDDEEIESSSSSESKPSTEEDEQNISSDESGGLTREDIAQLFKHVNLQKLCLKPYVKIKRLPLRVIEKWVKVPEKPVEKKSRTSQFSKFGLKVKFKQAKLLPKAKAVSPRRESKDDSSDNELPAMDVDSDSSDGLTEKIDIVDGSDGEIEPVIVKREVIQLTSGEVIFDLPIKLFRSLNKCSHPETRTLYIGTSTRNEWIKVVGKTRESFLYQCYYCNESKQEPKQVATHMTSHHTDLKELVQMGNTSKSNLFISCRHCDYISMQSKLFWYHFRSAHGVSQVLVPEAAEGPDVEKYMEGGQGEVDKSSLYHCAVQLCDYSTPSDKEIVCHMYDCHRYSDHIKEGFIRTQRSRGGSTGLLSELHQHDEAYVCTICRFVAYQMSLMDLHCFESHAQKLMLFVCDVCGEQFITQTTGVLETHMKEKHQQVKVKVSVTLIDRSGAEDSALVKQRPDKMKRVKAPAMRREVKKVLETESAVKAPVVKKYRPGPLSFKQRTNTPTTTDTETPSTPRVTPEPQKSTVKAKTQTMGKSAERSEVSSTTNWADGQRVKPATSVSTTTTRTDTLDLPDIVCKRRQRSMALVTHDNEASNSIDCGARSQATDERSSGASNVHTINADDPDTPLSMDCEDADRRTPHRPQTTIVQATTNQPPKQVTAPSPAAAKIIEAIVISDSDDDDVEIVKVDPKKTTANPVMSSTVTPQNPSMSFYKPPPQLSQTGPPANAPKAPRGRHQISWQPMGGPPLVQQVQPLVRLPPPQKQVITQSSPAVQHVLGGSFPTSTPLVMQITQPPPPTAQQSSMSVASSGILPSGGNDQPIATASLGSSHVTVQQFLTTTAMTGSEQTVAPGVVFGSHEKLAVVTGNNTNESTVFGNNNLTPVPGSHLNVTAVAGNSQNITPVIGSTSNVTTGVGNYPTATVAFGTTVLANPVSSATVMSQQVLPPPHQSLLPSHVSQTTAVNPSPPLLQAQPSVASNVPQATNVTSMPPVLQPALSQAPPVTLQGLCLVNIPPGGSLANISNLQIHPLVPSQSVTQPLVQTREMSLSSTSVGNTASQNEPTQKAVPTMAINTTMQDLQNTAAPPSYDEHMMNSVVTSQVSQMSQLAAVRPQPVHSTVAPNCTEVLPPSTPQSDQAITMNSQLSAAESRRKRTVKSLLNEILTRNEEASSPGSPQQASSNSCTPPLSYSASVGSPLTPPVMSSIPSATITPTIPPVLPSASFGVHVPPSVSHSPAASLAPSASTGNQPLAQPGPGINQPVSLVQTSPLVIQPTIIQQDTLTPPAPCVIQPASISAQMAPLGP